VFSAADAYQKIKLGANLVEMITGLIYQGPQVVGQINNGLVKLLDQDGYGTISEAVGSEL
jgi:dihydroorotate dehydrogenase